MADIAPFDEHTIKGAVDKDRLMLATLLITILTCANPSFCPSAAELRTALLQRRADEIATALAAKGVEDPGGIFTGRPRPITRWSDMQCDQPRGDEPRTLRCHVTVHYGSRRQRVTASLVRDGSGWSVIDETTIFTG
ncbi:MULTISPECIES: hypothetical protein [unclassified Sphingomonas]|jgi:hypothetical protein|nr:MULTISPECIES: hypothetical protein [unclassified Sphingomonas]